MHLAFLSCPCPDAEKAAELGQKLLAARLAACIQILPPHRSLYYWNDSLGNDSLENTTECWLLAKTTLALAPQAMQQLERWHPYEIPCILRMDVTANDSFALWVAEAVAAAPKETAAKEVASPQELQ